MRIQKGKPHFSQKELWNLDSTLAPIIHQALVQFKNSNRHGFPMLAVEDYLKEIKRMSEEQIKQMFKDNPNGDYNRSDVIPFFEQVLDNMIFAFSKEAKLDYYDIVEQPYNIRFMEKEDEGTVRFSQLITELKSGKTQEDYDLYQANEKQYYINLNLKVEKGLNLFARYFYTLWD